MTTIAYDGITLAADSQVSAGGCFLGYENKITKLTNGGYLASCGNTECCAEAEGWFNAGCPQDAKPKLESFGALYFPPDGGAVEEYRERLVSEVPFVPWAGGSGREWALSAMYLGKDAIAAVEFAISIDLYSGGEINSVIINQKGEK